MIQSLETPRLIMRPFLETDAEALFKMDSNPNVHRYLFQKPSITITETIETIRFLQDQYERFQIGRFATFLKSTGEFIGWTGIKFVADRAEDGHINFYDYGYRLDEPHWGKGYATEASFAWIKHAKGEMKLTILNAYSDSRNHASNRVLTKIGMNLQYQYQNEHGTLWNWWEMKMI